MGSKITPQGEYGRGWRLGIALDLLEWVGSRSMPFDKHELAAYLEVDHRTALRYLEAMRNRGMVETNSAGVAHGPEASMWWAIGRLEKVWEVKRSA